MAYAKRPGSVRVGSVSALVLTVGVLIGLVLVNDGRVDAAGQSLPGSGPYRLVEDWPQLAPDHPRHRS